MQILRYYFHKKNSTGDSVYSCINRRKGEGCKAIAVVSRNTGKILDKDVHNHGSSYFKTIAKDVEEKHIANAVTNTDKTPKNVIRDICAELQSIDFHDMPVYKYDLHVSVAVSWIFIIVQ